MLRDRRLDQQCVGVEGTSEFVRENAGAVIIRMLELIEAGANVADVIFPAR